VPKWNLTIPDDTDRLVRVLLARTGMKKGDLSSFVNEAVREQAISRMAEQLRKENPDATEDELRETLLGVVRRETLGELIDDLRARHADTDPDELQAEIDEAVAWVRAHPA
jgi:hypothetical protein